METYILAILFALLLNFAAFIWLVIVAFKRSVLWGLGVFFLSFLFAPIPAIIFAVLNWFDAKKAFLAYIFTTILVIVPLVMMLSQYDEEFVTTLSQKVESGEISEEEAVQYILNPELLKEEQAAEAQTDVLGDAEASSPALTDPQTTEDGIETQPAGEEAEAANQEETEIVVEEEISPYPKPGDAQPDPLVVKKKERPEGSVRVSLSKIANYKGRYFIITTKTGKEHRGILIKITKSRIILERKIYGGTFTYKVRKSEIKRIDMLKKEYVDELS